MIRHKRNIHEVSVNDSTRSSRMHCPSEDCQFIGKTLSEVRDHLRDVHTLYIKHSSLQFNNEEGRCFLFFVKIYSNLMIIDNSSKQKNK